MRAPSPSDRFTLRSAFTIVLHTTCKNAAVIILSRLSSLAFASLCAAVLLRIVVACVGWLRLRLWHPAIRPLLLIIGIAAFLATPYAMSVVARSWQSRPAPIVFWLPTVGVLVLLAAERLLFPRWPSDKLARRYRWALDGLALLLVALNVANWCQPGWCGRFGFPFSYEWWSDAIVMGVSAGFSATAAVGDAAVGLAAVSLLARSYRRAAARARAARGWDIETESPGYVAEPDPNDENAIVIRQPR